MSDYPKPIKRMLRELAGIAYEEEMRRELSLLAESFDAWRAGKIDVWELHERIHKYHNGPARRLYVDYGGRYHDMLVASAIVRGVLAEQSIPAELAPYLAGPLEFHRSQERRNQAAPAAAEGDEE